MLNFYAENSNSTLMTVIWIIVIIGVVFLFLLISFFVTLIFVKKFQKRAYIALDNLVPFEKERFEQIHGVYDYLLLEKKLNASNNPIKEIIQEQQIILSGNSIDMQKAKANDDFLILFLTKFMKEKSLKNKDSFKDKYEILEKYNYFDDKKDSPYHQYNKIALRYNSLSSMMTVSSYCRRKGYLKAPIL